jgi:hypothetical protein
MRGSQGVGDHSGGSTKPRRGVCPTHGEDNGERNEGLLAIKNGKRDAKFDHVGCLDPDTIEPVCQMDFDHLDGAKTGAGMDDAPNEAFECLSKLHGFHGSNWEGFLVEAKVGVIYDRAGSLALGRNDTDGATTKVLAPLDLAVR